MVGQTKMNRRNGATPPRAVANSVGELMHDMVSLAELQCELFRIDCREGMRQVLIPCALLLFAGTLAAGSVTIGLICLAQLLVQLAGLSQAAAFLIATLAGLVLAALSGVVGWVYLRRAMRMFSRSREEWAHNVTWIKRALKRPSSR